MTPKCRVMFGFTWKQIIVIETAIFGIIWSALNNNNFRAILNNIYLFKVATKTLNRMWNMYKVNYKDIKTF